ncbi:MAG: winged helix-turn-helix domain-containing protein, partial [Woeseia sp.]|nr:winged helix-turn-helix domain-containing protein [Woeseia sp.]
MREKLLQGFWLGELWIEPLTGTVTGANRKAHVPPRAIEVLLCLARQPGEIVSRSDLLAAAWDDPKGSGEALSHAVSDLRHGLGDHADTPEFIQTVPRRGYRLLQEPRPGGDADAAPLVPQMPLWQELMKRGVVQASVVFLVTGWLLIQVAGETFANLGLPAWSVPFVTYVVVAGFPVVVLLAWFLEFQQGRMTIDRDASTPRKGGGLMRNYLAVCGAYLIAAVGVSAYQLSVGIVAPGAAVVANSNNTEPALVIEPNSVAVLRFLNIDGEERARIFSDGLAEDVLDRLARVPGMLVSSRTDAWSLPAGASSADVRRRLRVANYLEGSVRLDGDSLRVTVQLIDSESGFHKFSRTFTRELVEFMEVQKEITDLTVANMRIAFEAQTQPWPFDNDFETDIDAYVLYRRGREVFDAPLTLPLLEQAVQYFRDALTLDPHYAAAHAGLCRANVEMYIAVSESERITAAEESCASALLANPNLFMVFTALGDLYRQTNRLELAELAYRNALERNSNDVDAMMGLARVFGKQNRLDEAEFQHRHAMLAQPGNWRLVNALGTFYFSTGQFAEAAAAFRQVIFLDP